MSIEFPIVDSALMAAGVIVLLRYWLTSRGGAWSCPPLLAHAPLRPEHVALPIMVFLCVHLAVVNALSVRGEPADVQTASDDEQLQGRPPEADLLANIAAQAVAGGVCLAVAGGRFAGGIRGFLLGPTLWWRSVLWASGGLLAALPLFWLTQWLSMLLLMRLMPDFEPPDHELLKLLGRPDLPGWVAPLLWIGAVVVAPLAEESFFRGLLQTGLRQFIRLAPLAIAIAAVVFGLAHASLLHGVLPLTVLGYFLGHVYVRTGALLAPVVMHALFNLMSMLFWTLGE